jgi:hypothetical protein
VLIESAEENILTSERGRERECIMNCSLNIVLLVHLNQRG